MKRSREGASDGVDDLTGGLPVYYDFVQATLSDDVVSAPIATSPRKAVKPRGSRKVASVSAPRESLEQLGASAASSVSEVPALSSSASSRADKLDLSEDIPTAKMPASAPGGMHAFAREHWDGLIKTGLAKIAIPSAAVRAQEECGPEIIKDILERVLGKSYKMNTYVYTFNRCADGYFKFKYSKSPPSFTASQFVAQVAKNANLSPFKGLPTEGDFSDDAYWAAVEKAADAGYKVSYPSDIHASVLKTVTDFPKAWNFSLFSEENDLLRALVPHLNCKGDVIEGYTTSMLYVGMPGSTFALHSEDQNFYSCNYLIAGAPKVWYSIPSSYYCAVIAEIKRIFAKEALVKSCPQAVMHKRFLVSPQALRDAGFPVSRTVQHAGEMMLSAPGAFHFGYNTGVNLAEASNFANKEWFFGGHFHDAIAVGNCTCTSFHRFHFDDDDVRDGLMVCGEPFGILPTDL